MHAPLAYPAWELTAGDAMITAPTGLTFGRCAGPSAIRANRLSWIVLAAVLVLLAGPVIAGDDDGTLTDEDRADLEFFGRLGFVDVAGKPYVEVATGRGWVDEEGVEHLDTFRGFLIKEDKDGRFEVLSDDLFVREYAPTGPSTPKLKRIGLRRLDLADEVKRLVTKARSGLEAEQDDPLGAIREHMALRFGERLSLRGRLLALAWASHRSKLDAEAQQLLALARRAGAYWNQETGKGPLRKDLYEEFATAMIWRAVEAFGDASIKRPQLLSTFKSFLATFGSSKHAKAAKEAVELLTQMIAADEKHARDSKPFAAMSKKEKIADLIFRLRDQNGGQFMQPGSPSIFFSMSDPDNENTPAHQLVAMGYDAVPQLIEALTDVRLTRTVGFWRNFTYSHYVVRNGDAALDILSRISNQGFWSGSYTAASMVKDGEQKETQERARAWWAEFQAKGERKFLIDAVIRADGNSSSAARVLLEKHPDDALAAIVKGLENCGDKGPRFWFVQLLAHDVPGKAQEPVLLREMKDGPTIDIRLTAAWWLVRHGHAEAVDAMAADWKVVRALPPWESTSVSNFANFFLYAGTDPAIECLTRGFEACPRQVRVEMLQDLNVRAPRHESWPPLGPRGEGLLEEFLVRQMGDEREAGFSSSTGNRSVDDARIADLAADRLAEMWGDSDAFDFYALMHERDRQIHSLTNRWRKKRGLDPVPDPHAQPGPLLPLEKSRALIQDWRDASSPESRAQAEEAMLKAGLALFPAVREAMATEKDKTLEPVARRLAIIVCEVRLRPPNATVGSRYRLRLDGLVGKPLTSAAMIRVLEGAPSEFSEGIQAVLVTVHRIGNDQGATVSLEFVPVPTGRKLHDSSWDIRPHIKRGRRTIMSYTSASESAPGPGDWASLKKPMDEVLSAAPEVPIRIHVSISRSLTSEWASPIPLDRVLEDARRAAGESDGKDKGGDK